MNVKVSKDESITTRRDLLQANILLITGILIFLSIYSGNQIIIQNITNENIKFLLIISIGLFVSSFICFVASIIIALSRQSNKQQNLYLSLEFLIIGLSIVLINITMLLGIIFGYEISMWITIITALVFGLAITILILTQRRK
jgi:hypothetical protein